MTDPTSPQITDQPQPFQTGLDKARAIRKAQTEAGIKTVLKNPLEKLADHPTSLRKAVNAKCFQCEGENADPAVKRRIGTCAIKDCGLWAVRPYQHMASMVAESEEETDDDE